MEGNLDHAELAPGELADGIDDFLSDYELLDAAYRSDLIDEDMAYPAPKEHGFRQFKGLVGSFRYLPSHSSLVACNRRIVTRSNPQSHSARSAI
jgi:hypothetical protein